MLLAKTKTFTAISLVCIRKIIFFVRKTTLRHRVCNPSCLVHITKKEVFWCQGVSDQFNLEGKTLMELRYNSSIFFNKGFKFAFFIVFTLELWVGDVENCSKIKLEIKGKNAENEI